ncbi:MULTISPECIES: hypothetical protein [unclassified Streptomyces]|uniref:hypothetical protein n=1 Tax=unclassified Streptomyces TaxID=2593676 RepID=UPI002365F6FB|nr:MULTISPECIES: hypothetical protein [unclassified Streptomyces]MDF3140347.1 hypothetical protein [Streptomyces sp. T21Q-yed]WDF39382.1 hypothetical protein PBV52_22530 [Streptomyces sp. T12]
MRKIQKAAVAAAILGSFSFIATAPAAAYDGHGHGCKSHDLNVDILGQVGVLPGLLGNAVNGEGNAGGMWNHTGSSCGH